MDLNLLCRLCAKEDRLCIQVFGPEGKKQSVAKKIRLCMPIVVKESDDFPKQICLSCLSNLDTSYELYKRCLEAQSVIKNLMMVNTRSSGEVVKVYSRQEMLNMAKGLREKMCERQSTMRLGNTVFTTQEARSQAEGSGNEPIAKKRKEAAAKAAGRSVMYPIGQQYMLMPSTSLSPAVVIPSAAPHGQFAVAPVPAIPTFPIQAVPSTAITTAPTVVTNASEAATQAPSATKPGAAPSTIDTATAQEAVLPGSTLAVTPANNSDSTALPPLPSIQNAIQAFQSLSQGRIALVQPIMSTQGNSATIIPQLPTASSSFNLINITENTSSPLITEPQESSVQQTPLDGMAPLQSVTSVRTNDPEQILPHVTSDVTGSAPIVTKTSPPTDLQQSSSQKSQSGTFMREINQTDDNDDGDKVENDNVDDNVDNDDDNVDDNVDNDDDNVDDNVDNDDDNVDDNVNDNVDNVNDNVNNDDDNNVDNNVDNDDANESAADDSDTLQENGEQEEQEAPVVENPVTEMPSENRDESNPAVEEINSDDEAGDQERKHKCPYCNKHFPEDVIFHHRKLHFRQKFFSCIMCNKNFRTEAGLETHRCEQS